MVVSRRYAIQILKTYKKHLTIQEFRTFKGQTENDAYGCLKGLKKLLNKKGIENNITL